MPLTWKAVLPALAGAAALICAAGADAHGKGRPEHGGVLQLVGETSIELVNRPDKVELYVEDEGEEIASSGMDAKILVNGPAKREVVLTSAEGNKFEAKGVQLPKGSEVTVLLTAKDTQARTTATFKIN